MVINDESDMVSIAEYRQLFDMVKSAAIAEAKQTATKDQEKLLQEWPTIWEKALQSAIAEAKYKAVSYQHNTVRDSPNTSNMQAEKQYVRTYHYLSVLLTRLAFVQSYIDVVSMGDFDISDYLSIEVDDYEDFSMSVDA